MPEDGTLLYVRIAAQTAFQLRVSLINVPYKILKILAMGREADLNQVQIELKLSNK